MDLGELIKKLSACEDVRTVLRVLLKYLKGTQVFRLRYYRLDEGGERMVSVESAGMPGQVARSFRAGAIIKFRKTADLGQSDSFWCFAEKKAIVFCCDPVRASYPLAPEHASGSVWTCYVSDDPCYFDLEGAKSPHWVDIPVVVGRECYGKVSCDLDSRRFALSSDLAFVEDLVSLVRSVAPFLYTLDAQEHSFRSFTFFAEKLNALQSIDELFDYVTTELPNSDEFDCTNASIFTYYRDDLGTEKLILRRTSFGKLRGRENKAEYNLLEEGLTPWIARTRRSLRLQDLFDEDSLKKQLAAYDPDLHWADKYTDSNKHTTFLGVPLLQGDRLVGALRFTERRRRAFTERHQQLLERLAQECIGPRLAALSGARLQQALLPCIPAIMSISIQVSTYALDLSKALQKALSLFFAENAHTSKLYVLNLLDASGNKFRHHFVGGGLDRSDLLRETYDLEGTLTKYALEHADRPVFFNDLKVAGSTGRYLDICPSAVCGLAAAVKFGGTVYGVLGVLSDSYDLDPEIHGPILGLCAAETAEVLARERLVDRTAALVGMKHDTNYIYDAILHDLNEVELPPEIRQHIETLFGFLHSTSHTYLRYGETAPALFEKHECFNTHVRDEILKAEVALRVDVPTNCGLDCRIPEDLAVRINGAFLRSIVYNLIKNAWNASDEASSPPVEIEATVDDGYLAVSITDHGCGMSTEDAERLRCTDPLSEVLQPLNELPGVGVPLARRVARWHQMRDGRQGSVTLDYSEPGRGSRFVVRLPISTVEL